MCIRDSFKMVMNCHKERRFLLETQPHLTNWRAVGVPINRWVLWPPPFDYPPAVFGPMGLFSAFFKFYDAMSGFSCPSSHIVSPKRAHRIFPQLEISGLKYAQVFYEGQHNDARTNVAIALSAAQQGASISNYVQVVSLLRDEASGEVTGVTALDRLSNETFDIHAKGVLFCGGPFTDELRRLEDPTCEPAVTGAAGIHVVLPSYYCPKTIGLVDMATSDGRFLFFLPWLGHCLVGTTDSPMTPTMRPVPAEDEIQWIINEASKYLDGGLRVRRSDVLSAWSGIRPLMKDPNATATAGVSRDHTISVEPTTKTVFVAGGKWTTYREMAQEAVDKIVELKGLQAGECSTLSYRLLGYEGYHSNLAVELVQEWQCSHEVAVHLASTYGGNAHEVLRLSSPTGELWPKRGVQLVANYPYIEAEVTYVCRHEMACTAEDIIARRTRLAFLNVAAARTATPRVIDIMAQELGWDDQRVLDELDKTHTFIDTFGGPEPNKESGDVKLRANTTSDLRSMFDQIDVDGSGTIDEQEMAQLATNIGFPLSEMELQAAMYRMDKDRNGQVEFDDFVAWWNSENEDKLQQAISKQIGLRGNQKATGVLFG
eukprot:TRINITY_DN2199_c0_g2_i4.p1 TRINITY_DN2199_c0_g2~~TRINITY_DN2199_c0_g2_i4.p1  ORF type:complete len:599 (-),score=156.63 TRINITY_DN2199_c0_g2_i4:261-2057(-)